jgi:hypothetical protein
MNRRQFVSRVSLGAAAACTTIARPSIAAGATGQATVRFVGMMGFIERQDRSYLVATPGQHHHMNHVPFLMARKGSPIAKALQFAPQPTVIPEAFDTTLAGTRPEDFVFRSLNNTSLDIVTGTRDVVTNDATQLAQMNQIAPGKRVRGNVAQWASSTISLRGGRLENSAAHPDAGRVWSFAGYTQRLTDAVNFKSEPGAATTIRLTTARDAMTHVIPDGHQEDLWVFSAAAMDAGGGSPTRIVHSDLVFDYLVDATPVIAECPTATGRTIPETEVPFVEASSASLGIVASRMSPPDTWLCWMAYFGLAIVKK